MDGLPRSRRELKDWCLRKLGAPILQINLHEDQIEDRLSEGLAYFRDYHFDGVEKVLLKHKITASQLTFVGPVTGTFEQNECVSGLTSGATAYFIRIEGQNMLVQSVTGTFVANEVVKGSISLSTVTLANTNFVTLGDIDNGWIPVDDSIIGVTDILQFNSGLPSTGSMFDINYQFALNNMHSLINLDLITYDMFKRQIALLNFMFQGTKGFRFNRVTDKIYLDIDWKKGPITAEDYVILVCYKAVDPLAYTEVYSNYFVREYCYMLLKKNWGEVLKKYTGIALPGNTTLNGQTIYNEAVEYQKELEDRIKKEWMEPVDFLIG
jgi:hypothetical protein